MISRSVNAAGEGTGVYIAFPAAGGSLKGIGIGLGGTVENRHRYFLVFRKRNIFEPFHGATPNPCAYRYSQAGFPFFVRI